MAKEVSDNNFKEEVEDSNIPVVVDFWAEWCGPCKMIAPVIEQLAKTYEGKVKIVKLNVDENPSKPSELGIRGIPTLMLFKGGKQVDTKVGAHPQDKIASWIDSHL